MFSPLNDPQVTDWFRRLDAAWRRMPTEEQTRQREEIQQHLEALATSNTAQGQPLDAAWNAALEQFGDPAYIGRKVYQEWCQSKTGFRADVGAILLGIVLYVLLVASIQIERYSGLFEGSNVSHFSAVGRVLDYAETILIYAGIGRRYPFQAIKGSLYSQCFGFCCLWTYLCISAPIDILRSMAVVLPGFALGAMEHTAIAYLASVTKRGWYKPTLDDFKITPPSRTKQTSR